MIPLKSKPPAAGCPEALCSPPADDNCAAASCKNKNRFSILVYVLCIYEDMQN